MQLVGFQLAEGNEGEKEWVEEDKRRYKLLPRSSIHHLADIHQSLLANLQTLQPRTRLANAVRNSSQAGAVHAKNLNGGTAVETWQLDQVLCVREHTKRQASDRCHKSASLLNLFNLTILLTFFAEE